MSFTFNINSFYLCIYFKIMLCTIWAESYLPVFRDWINANYIFFFTHSLKNLKHCKLRAYFWTNEYSCPLPAKRRSSDDSHLLERRRVSPSSERCMRISWLDKSQRLKLMQNLSDAVACRSSTFCRPSHCLL